MQMPIFTIQRSSEYFEDPLVFIPERWVEGTPEEAANRRVPGSWMAFGEGTRVCVGQRFALQEAKITLACIFQRCEPAARGLGDMTLLLALCVNPSVVNGICMECSVRMLPVTLAASAGRVEHCTRQISTVQ